LASLAMLSGESGSAGASPSLKGPDVRRILMQS
jgi:hypothetical protein